jgi:vitamin B12 transporter
MRKKFFVVAAVFFSSQVHAQDSAKVLDQVEVTSNKYPVKQSQSGKVVTIIDRATLDKSAGKTLGEILSEQEGLTVNGALNNLGTNQSIYLQGTGSGRTLITVDGVPVIDPTSVNNLFDINLISLDNIERIEISEGAQSTLYGSDAIAGVINIITIKPDVKGPLHLKATVSGGNYGTDKAAVQLYGRPIDKLVYNISYTQLNSTGFSAAYDSSGHGNFDNDGYRANNLTGNLAWSLCKDFTLKGFAQYTYYKTDIDAGAFTDAKNDATANKNFLGGIGFTYKLNRTTLNGTYRYNTTDRLNMEDSIFKQPYVNNHLNGRTQYAEVFGNTNIGHGFTWLYGADYSFALMNSQYASISSFGPFAININDTSASEGSLYTSFFYQGKSGFNLEFGGRYNNQSKYGTHGTYTFNPSYIFKKNWKVYASVASGYKAPSLYQLYSVNGVSTLKPESSTNYEAGVQYGNNKINARANFFYHNIDDGINFNSTTNLYFNNDNEKATGAELETRIQLTKALSLTANYTFTKVQQQTQNRIPYFTDTNFVSHFHDTTYNYAIRQPESVVNATVGLQATRQWYISATAHYESKRYDIGGYQVPDVVLNDFLILNAYTEYKFSDEIKFFVDAKNVTNKKFFTIYGYNSIPFIISGGVTVNL